MSSSRGQLIVYVVLGLGALARTATVRAADVPVAGLKLVVVDKTVAAGTAKAAFVAKDAAISKGPGTDASDISAVLDIVYDASSGQFAMPRGGKWVVNSTNVAKYVNASAPASGATKVGIIKPGSLVKIVARSLGDDPLDISVAPSDPVHVAHVVVNGADTTRHCTQFASCAHKAIAGGTGWKLVCKDGTGDPTCGGVVPPVCGDGALVDGESCDPPGSACGTNLLCDARCLCHLCGNGAIEEGEQCDDGGTASGDGCDAGCQLEEAVSGANSVTTDGENDGASPADPVETSVSSPVAGPITVIESSVGGEVPAGLGLLDRVVTITAPTATASMPLQLQFLLDSSLLPDGLPTSSIVVFRDGLPLGNCTGSPGEAQPDPCVAARASLPGGDVAITALSSHASGWGFGTNVVLSFTSTPPGGVCGTLRAGGAAGTVRKSLACGGLELGGGVSTVPEAAFRHGGQTQMNGACDSSACAVTGRSAAETGSNDTCSMAGCPFGPYLPIANAGTSACVQNSFVAPVSGTLDHTLGAFTGSFPLSATIYLTGNGTSPCPRCVGGAVGIPNSGVCDPAWLAGTGNPYPDAGAPCTPTNASGDTYDCEPSAATMLGALPVDANAMTTGTSTLANASGVFCASQATPGAFGCRGSGPANPICPGGNVPPVSDYMAVTGAAAGAITPGPHAIRFASAFCIPSIGGSLGFLVNAAADLPGPGAVTLPGSLEVGTATTSTSTTTTTIPPPAGTMLRLITGSPAGSCGSVRSGGSGGAIRKFLSCGGVNVGGGQSTLVEAAVPMSSVIELDTACTGATCTVAARTAAETGSNDTCSDTGCRFGPYMPMANAGTSVCLNNTFLAPASGTLDTVLGTFTGSFPLASALYLTANGSSPCPRCVGGTVGLLASGVCDPAWLAGSGNPYPDAGAPCTPVNASGDTYDCEPPAATLLGTLAFALTPLTTGTASMANAGGLFCPSQAFSGAFGCAGSGAANALCPGGNVPPLIDYIAETGSAAGSLTPGLHPITLASTFCVPTVGGSLGFLVNAAADLPGPGAVSLPASAELLP